MFGSLVELCSVVWESADAVGIKLEETEETIVGLRCEG